MQVMPASLVVVAARITDLQVRMLAVSWQATDVEGLGL